MSDEKLMIPQEGAGFDSRRLHSLTTETTQESSQSVPPSHEPAQNLPKKCRGCAAPVPHDRKVFCTEECRTYFRNHRVARIPATCASCGESFMARRQSVAEGHGECCSRACSGRYATAIGTYAGENSPRWIDGRSLDQKWPEKILARRAVKRELRSGRMARQPCEKCGTTQKVHAHHEDYSKPLDVRLLCPTHHADAHLEMRGLSLSKGSQRRRNRRTTTTRPTRED